MSSDAERELRDAVVARLRILLPRARIVHELNIAGQSSSRIDVAAVGPDYLVGVEIKSERDTLKRLADQWDAFGRVCDVVIVAAHRKHFEEWRDPRFRAEVCAELSLKHDLGSSYRFAQYLWCFPKEQELNLRNTYGKAEWSLGNQRKPFNPLRPSPGSAPALLEMLWRSELAAVCGAHGVAATSRSTRGAMIYDLAMMLTGKEVKRAVCGALRGREFAEADAPARMQEAAE